ncbi:MAG: ABC transporter ATP-binding protein [Clostridia bacterium]|nr:ABC transporter ATP-binding protein [Clostridia bacterium]
MFKKVKQKKEPKRKPKYGMLSCVGYIYRLLWAHERGLAFVGIFTVPVSLLLAAITLYLPTAVLSALETQDRFSYIALVICGILLAKLLLNLSNQVINIKTSNAEHYVLLRMMYMLQSRQRDRDWYLDFEPEIRKSNERAESATENNHTAGVHFPMDFADMLSQVLKFLLFGSVISLLHPAIILLLAVGTGVNALAGRWLRERNYDDRDIRNALDRKIWYTSMGLSRNFGYAKDIRLYTMEDSVKNRGDRLFAARIKEQGKLELRAYLVALVSFLVVLVRDGAVYAFLIYKAVQGEVDASSFVLYFSAITSMASLMGGILGTFDRVASGALQISDFREALEIPDRLNRGAGIPTPTAPFSVEFRHVTFRYPEGEKTVLDDISFRIEPGEKIALVGLNGAGKTTLTLLMCGLLLPTSGEVLLDGHPLTDYNRDEMYRLFGFVPQEYHLLPVSIARNIAAAMTDDDIDRDRLAHCIEVAGLTEKIASLPLGADTPLNREVHPDGIALSGGEEQKLLLARLLYKDPLCIVLDEPTAALDPIAEDRMYRRYNEIAAHATSVFISHRLASTRFCDRIFLLDGARFAEVGTHDELMQRGGKYRELFDIQSKYYRESADSEHAEEAGEHHDE